MAGFDGLTYSVVRGAEDFRSTKKNERGGGFNILCRMSLYYTEIIQIN